ncbi:hypothetical protein [Streptomyces sp. NBC_01445]|uniref:hypothetical protein n=1 Tax=Streptomyces sp. NBC_01445 TaxID=2903869 RepID=UPI002DD9C341|nr:hypothetical protein [Streptomyces sp. NBC_01445]WSE03830.1 hypothetical protein OG574_10870 [Streptomyces sp. NBC_01445]
MFRFKSHDTLAEAIVEHLAYGQIVILRAMPGSGRSVLLSNIADKYKDIIGCAPRILRPEEKTDPDSVVQEVESQIARWGQAALLLDDWGRMVRSSPDTPWQQRMTRLCVDGPQAISTGALVVGAPGENLSRFGEQASPLVDAAHEVFLMPLLTVEEISQALCEAGIDGVEAQSAAREYGGSVGLLRSYADGRLTEAKIEEAVVSVAYHAQSDAAQRIIDLSRKEGLELACDDIDVRLCPVVIRTSSGRSMIARAFHSRNIKDLVTGSGPAWPRDRKSAVQRFYCRIYGSDDVFWYDRYMSTGLPDLTDFLGELSTVAEGRNRTLRLLSGSPFKQIEPAVQARFVSAATTWAARGLHVYWHTVQKRDIGPLHDRQLVSRSRLEGHHLPPADRMVGKVPAGNENDALLPHAPIASIEAAWLSSSCLMCPAPSSCEY